MQILPLKAFYCHTKKQNNKSSFFQLGEALQDSNGWWARISVTMIPASLLGPLHPPTHQAGKDRHHHLGLHLHKVFWEGIDACSDLPRHRDCVPRGARRGWLGQKGFPHKPPKKKKNMATVAPCSFWRGREAYLAFSSFSSSERLPVLSSS